MLNKKLLLIIAVILAILVIYDITIGKKNPPAFHTAPQAFCSMEWHAITLPPFGIFVCDIYETNTEIKNHELVHWEQYRRMGSLTFYGNYVAGWIASGFNYRNNWMEQEAYENSNGSAL